MKQRIVLVLAFACLGSLSLFARRAATAEPITPSVDPAIAELATQYRDINTLVEKARRDAEQARRKAQREIEQVHGRMSRRQSRLERRRQEALRKEAQERAVLEQQAREQAQDLAKKAEDEALKIIQSAERRALDLRNKLQAQDAQDRAASRPKITPKWQREVRVEYDADAAFMRDIIMQGEPSRIERENFAALFNEQKDWLDATIKKVEFFFDDSYQAVMKKKNGLAGVVDAQRQADEIIYDLVDKHHLSADVKAQLRLMALYEINNHIQQSKSAEVFLSADTIAQLVNNISGDVAPGQRDIRIVSEKERIGSLEERIAELEQQLAEQEAAPRVADDDADDDIADDADSFDQKQDALLAGRKSYKKRIAELEQERDKTVAHLEEQARTKIEQLNKEKADLVMESAHTSSEAAAALDDQEKELEREKKASIEQAEKVAQMRIAELKKRHQAVKDQLNHQREEAVDRVRKQLEELRAEKRHAEDKLTSGQVDLATERAKSEKLSSQLSNAQGTVESLKGKLSELESKHAELAKKVAMERADFVRRIEDKKAEHLGLEVQLSKVKDQLTVLSTQSSDRLLTLAGQLSHKEGTQADLERMLAQKTQERIELEVAVAQAQEHLAQLSAQSQDMLSELSNQLDHSEYQCGLLQEKLADKQQQNVELELLVNKMHTTNAQVYDEAASMSRHISVLSRERAALRDRVAHLQRALSALKEQHRIQGGHDAALVERARALTHQAQEEVVRLTALLARQHRDLNHRRQSFDHMHRLRERLHYLRSLREHDPVRDAHHAQVLAQMALFGDQVLNNYFAVDSAVNDIGRVYNELADVGAIVDRPDALVSPEFMADLEHALSGLGDAAHISQDVPEHFEQQEVLVAPKRKSRAVMTQLHDDDEEEEAPHEPDDHGDHPEVTEDLEGELDAQEHESSVENFLAQEEPLAEDDTQEAEMPEPEEMIAVAPDLVESPEEDDDDEDEDEDDQEAAEEYGHDQDDDDDDDEEENEPAAQSGLSDAVLDMLLEEDD